MIIQSLFQIVSHMSPVTRKPCIVITEDGGNVNLALYQG